MLSFELKKPRVGEMPDELEVFLDRTGLEGLLAQLRFIEEGKTEHVHLMTESWGGSHLCDRPHDDNLAVSHVKIMLQQSSQQ